jgi:diguanylate cyclase (GGDEF)-like protein/putative nucleotidyltransferase with HDIG domain
MSSEISDLYLETIRSLVLAIEARDPFELQHTANVERLALAIGRKMNFSTIQMEGLRTAALLHDIGKLGVPEYIRMKPGELGAYEFSRLRSHPVLGQRMLQAIDYPWPIGKIIRSHHERWNGSGYPDGLKGNDIPLESRILRVADIYDGLTSDRPNRTGVDPKYAVEFIRQSSGIQFDPEVVRAFEQVAAENDLPVGNDYTHFGQLHEELGVGGSAVEDISRASSEFVAMFDIIQSATSSLNIEELLPLLGRKIRTVVDCSLCVIFLHDEDSDLLHVRIAQGVGAEHFIGLTVPAGRGLTGMVAQTQEGLISECNASELSRMGCGVTDPAQMVEFRSLLIVPILCDHNLIGTINLYHEVPNAFDEECLDLMNALSPQVGRAIRNSLLFERTKEFALTDMLTGLHNARYLLIQLEHELNRTKRSDGQVSILSLDLDNFKAINDTFGHLHGDIALQRMAQMFLEQVRSYDLVSRYAGDEFVIVLPDVKKQEAIETAERIRNAVDGMDPYKRDGKEISLGVSIGVATYPEDSLDVRGLVVLADERMYMDKRRRKEASGLRVASL